MTSAQPTRSNQKIQTATQPSTLADILERVLDKGIVIAGDISVSVASTELLSVRIRLLISSVDKAKELGINWWEGDPFLRSQARQLAETNQQLQTRLAQVEAELRALRQGDPESLPQLPDVAGDGAREGGSAQSASDAVVTTPGSDASSPVVDASQHVSLDQLFEGSRSEDSL